MGPSKRFSLSEVLFTGVQRRVLALLFGHPGRSFYMNELARLAGTGKGALQRELGRLVSAGVVDVTAIGRQRHYQANSKCPIFDELRGITIKTFGLTDVVREALMPLRAAIRVALIFGSVAKSTDTSASDIDMLVVSDELTYVQLHETLSHAEMMVGRKLSPTLYSLKEFNRRLSEGNHFLARVLQQEQLPLIGDIHELVPPQPGEPGEDRQAEGRGTESG
jgi:predicted nucleotidyltransferase